MGEAGGGDRQVVDRALPTADALHSGDALGRGGVREHVLACRVRRGGGWWVGTWASVWACGGRARGLGSRAPAAGGPSGKPRQREKQASPLLATAGPSPLASPMQYRCGTTLPSLSSTCGTGGATGQYVSTRAVLAEPGACLLRHVLLHASMMFRLLPCAAAPSCPITVRLQPGQASSSLPHPRHPPTPTPPPPLRKPSPAPTSILSLTGTNPRRSVATLTAGRLRPFV